MKLKEIAIILVLVLVSYIFFVGHSGLPRDINAEVLSNVLAAKWSWEAHQAGMPLLSFFQNIFKEWSLLFEPKSLSLFSGFFIYYFYVYTSPLPNMTATLFVNFIGLSYQAIILHSLFYGLLTVLTTYIFFQKISDKKTAFLTSIFLVSSLFFVIQIRVGYIVYGQTIFLTAFGLYFFILAHKTKEVKWLWASGFVYTAHLLSAYFGIIIVPLIMGSFLIWEFLRKGKKFLFPLKIYIFVFLVSLLFYVVFAVSYSWFYQGETFGVLTKTAEHLTLRKPYSAGGIEAHFATTGKFLKALFWDMETPGTHQSQYMAGRPMLNYVISLFFLTGVYLAIKKRDLLDRFLLCWIGVVFALYGFLLDFQHRYIALAAPAIYFFAAYGVVFCWGKIKNLKFRFLNFLVIFIILAVLTINYIDYYFLFAKRDFNLWRYHGQAEMSEYIKNNFDPQTTFVIFGDKVLIPYANFLVKTWNDNYQVQFWSNITIDFSSEKELKDWQDEIFKKYSTIVYIFTPDNRNVDIAGREPGPYFTDWSLFKELYPEKEPVKTVYYSSGIAEMMIYVVKK